MGTPVIDWSRVDAASGAMSRDELAAESLACLGATICLNGLPVPAVTAGTLVLLAALDSPLLRESSPVTPADVETALAILHGGRDAVAMANATITAGADYSGLRAEMREIIAIAGVSDELLAVYVKGRIGAACAGFATLPTTDDPTVEQEPFAFDAMWLAHYVTRICPATGLTMDAAIWELPLTMGGYLLAQLAKAAGVKGVGRKADDAAALAEIDRQMEAQHGR